jgi:hypothetical protein
MKWRRDHGPAGNCPLLDDAVQTSIGYCREPIAEIDCDLSDDYNDASITSAEAVLWRKLLPKGEHAHGPLAVRLVAVVKIRAVSQLGLAVNYG